MTVTASDKYLIFNLYNGHSYNELYNPKKPKKKRSYPHRYDTFKEQQIIIELTGFGLQRTDQNLFKSHYQMLDIKQLGLMKDSIENEISKKHDQMYTSLLLSNYFKKKSRKRHTSKPPTGPTRIDNEKSQSLIDARVINHKKKIRDNNSKKVLKEKQELELETVQNDEKIKDAVRINATSIINIDSLYATITLQEKSRVTNSALSQSRTAKNLVVNSLQSLEFKSEQLRRYEIEWHRKFTLSFACILFMFIGAPLGAIIRKGGLGLPLIISVFFFILYYVLSLIGDKLVRKSIVLDYQGMWATSVLFLIIGAFITYKATTDSAIFNMDTYSNFIKKLFGQRFNIVDKIHIQTQSINHENQEAKVDKLYSSLIDLNDSVEKMFESTLNNLRITDFVLSLYFTNHDSELIIFERYYHNTFKALINHHLFHNKHVRAKTYEFPALNIKEFQDSKLIRHILIIFACLPPLTIIVIARRYIKIIVLRAKLKHIKQLIPELGTLLKIADSLEKNNENSTSL